MIKVHPQGYGEAVVSKVASKDTNRKVKLRAGTGIKRETGQRA
jgi:hypothetical protein